jgi:NADPH:quinone reductase-like Zn-dependent oxidoreductase
VAAPRFSVILDIASTSSFAEAAGLLADGGAYVGFLPSPALALGVARAVLSAKRCTFLIVRPSARDFDQLARWFDDGTLAPVLDRSYPLAELPAALAHQRTGAVLGKLAITI